MSSNAEVIGFTKKWKENLSDLVNGYFRVLRLLLCYQKKGEPKDGRNDLY